MPTVINAKKDYEREVRVKFIPVDESYKGVPLSLSAQAEGRSYSASLRPGIWCKVPVILARQAKHISKKGRKKMVPDGSNLERDMEQGIYNHKDGSIHSSLTEEYNPNFEIIIDGDIS